MTNEEKAEHLNLWFSNRELPQQFNYGEYYKGLNPALYVETAKETMQHSEPTSNAFKASYWRLYRLKKHLEENK